MSDLLGYDGATFPCLLAHVLFTQGPLRRVCKLEALVISDESQWRNMLSSSCKLIINCPCFKMLHCDKGEVKSELQN